VRRARVGERLHDLRPVWVVGSAHTDVRPDRKVLERLALGVEVAPQYGGRRDGLEAEVGLCLGNQLVFLGLEFAVVELHAVAGEVDRAGAHPIRVADPQPRKRPGLHPHVACDREGVARVGVVGGDAAAIVALAWLDDPLAGARSGQAPSLPAADRLVEVEVVRRGRVLPRLTRRRRRLQVALVGRLHRVEGRFTIARLEHVFHHAAMQREPAGAARGVLVEDVDAVAAHQVLGAEGRILARLEIGVAAAPVLEVLEQHVGSPLPRHGEPGRAQRWEASLALLALRPVLGLAHRRQGSAEVDRLERCAVDIHLEQVVHLGA
jgi:hypothetical protein